tara:strand:+ start:208 stop:540 length:333 start_codon:yes stop_codon:yes gene_type:complete
MAKTLGRKKKDLRSSFRPPKIKIGYSKESWATQDEARKAGATYLANLEPRYALGRSIRVTKDNRPVGGISGIDRAATVGSQTLFPHADFIRRDRNQNPGIRFTYEIWKLR